TCALLRRRHWRTGPGSSRPSNLGSRITAGAPGAPLRGPGGTVMKTTAIDELDLTTRIGEVLNSWPVAGLAVGVVRHGSLAWFHGHGVADIAAGTPIDQGTVFRIASVTKTITAIAVMQLQEQGLVDL